MELTNIKCENLNSNIFELWKNKWMLLTCGDYEKNDFNTMTVAWGSFGHMWDRYFVQVVVRPSRFTYGFMEKYDTFTLSAFSDQYQDALMLLGTKSGRDGNKISEAGLTPLASEKIAAPAFAEAELIFECKKMYWDDLAPKNFLDAKITQLYPDQDFHRIYFGEILVVRGEDKYGK